MRTGDRTWRALRWGAVIALVAGAGGAGPATARAASDGSAAVALAATVPCDTAGTPTSTAYLPNITKTLGGPAGWVTPWIVQNVGATATTLEVSYYRFSDGALVTCRKATAVAPGTSFSEVPNENVDLADNSQFSVVVRSFGAQVVAVVNEQQGAGATAEALSYSGLSTGATRLALPYVADQVAGWLTTMVIQNLGAGTAAVSASFISADGTKTATLARSIAPGRSAFVDPRFETALAVGTEYAATLSADQPIAAIVNAHNDAAGVAAPMGFSYNGVVVAGAAQMYLPYAARNTDGIGRTSRIVVQNAGSVDATPTLTFQKLGGAPPVAVTAPAAVKPGRSWSFDLRLAADGTTPCPAGGGPACVAEGEHSLFTSGGVFAVLGITLSPATAMGYIGAAPAPSRVYLPNITRTLGGSSGWTTPIIVQSAGATSAQLRWFRFADGSLVQTQSLTGLSAGASQRVDPRNVAGLAEATQYAVVIDAPGPVTAIVTELNFLGGDSAMAYEGFPSTQAATPAAASVSVSPAIATLQRGATQQFAATVKDQFGATMALAPAWSVTPSTLGTIDSTGLFTAGQAGGTGTVTATAAGIGGTAAVTVQVPATTTIGGITFRVTASASADTYVEATITDADSQTILALIEPAVTSVQTAYARTYATRPQFYAFGTTASFANGWTAVLGGTGAPSTTALGVFFPGSNRIGLNWENMKGGLPYRTPRHEVTHMMNHQLAGTGTFPVWFDEGSARLQDLTEPGSNFRVNQSRYDTATLAANNLLFAVALADKDFSALGSSLENDYAYYESAETVRLMRNDLGQPSLDRLLELIAQGQTFTAAYATVSGNTWDSFLSARPARLKALSSTYPGIATATDTFQGPGLTILYYGFTPNSSITPTISGPGGVTGSGTPVTVDKYGTYGTYLGSTWPTGSYTITAAGPNGTATTTAVKTTSFFASEFP